MDRRSWAMLFFLASIWGASYLFIKVGLRDLSPAMIAFLRTALAALVLAPIAMRSGALKGLGPRLGALSILAAVQVAAPFFLIGLGEEEISSSLAGILVASTPVFTAILAIWVDEEERSSGWRLAGVGIGLVGVAVLLGVDLGGSSAALLGGLMVVLASLGYAIGGLYLKHRLGDVAPIGIVTGVMIASAAMLLPVALLTAPASMPDLAPIASMLALGLLGTGLAFVIFYSLIAAVGPARTLLVTYIAPGFAVIYGVVLLDEQITIATLGGLGLIIAGSWLAAEGKPRPAEPAPVRT